MINDMGIRVFESAPDADDLMEVIEGQGYATKRQISRMKRLAT